MYVSAIFSLCFKSVHSNSDFLLSTIDEIIYIWWSDNSIWIVLFLSKITILCINLCESDFSVSSILTEKKNMH